MIWISWTHFGYEDNNQEHTQKRLASARSRKFPLETSIKLANRFFVCRGSKGVTLKHSLKYKTNEAAWYVKNDKWANLGLIKKHCFLGPHLLTSINSARDLPRCVSRPLCFILLCARFYVKNATICMCRIYSSRMKKKWWMLVQEMNYLQNKNFCVVIYLSSNKRERKSC